MKLRVRNDGSITCVYTDALDLRALGKLVVRRASTVEFDHERQMWRAVLTDGTLVGEFVQREDAIRAEIELLEQRRARPGRTSATPKLRAATQQRGRRKCMRKEVKFVEMDHRSYDASICPISSFMPEEEALRAMTKRGHSALEFLKSLCDVLNSAGFPSRIVQDGYSWVFKSPVDATEIDVDEPEHSLKAILASLESLDAEFELYPKFGVRFFEPEE